MDMDNNRSPAERMETHWQYFHSIWSRHQHSPRPFYSFSEDRTRRERQLPFRKSFFPSVFYLYKLFFPRRISYTKLYLDPTCGNSQSSSRSMCRRCANEPRLKQNRCRDNFKNKQDYSDSLLVLNVLENVLHSTYIYLSSFITLK